MSWVDLRSSAGRTGKFKDGGGSLKLDLVFIDMKWPWSCVCQYNNLCSKLSSALQGKKSYLLQKKFGACVCRGDELRCTLHYLCIKEYLIAL